jgi:hypothetical protein
MNKFKNVNGWADYTTSGTGEVYVSGSSSTITPNTNTVTSGVRVPVYPNPTYVESTYYNARNEYTPTEFHQINFNLNKYAIMGMITALYKQDKNPSINENQAIYKAACARQDDIVKFLLEDQDVQEAILDNDNILLQSAIEQCIETDVKTYIKLCQSKYGRLYGEMFLDCSFFNEDKFYKDESCPVVVGDDSDVFAHTNTSGGVVYTHTGISIGTIGNSSYINYDS